MASWLACVPKSIVTAAGLMIALACAPTVYGRSPQTSRVAEAGRSRVNFNADWRFRLGKAADAQAPTFDDSGWQRVGLPHSFSIPIFVRPISTPETAGTGKRSRCPRQGPIAACRWNSKERSRTRGYS